MRLCALLILVGALAGCAQLREAGQAIKDATVDVVSEIPGALDAGLDAVIADVPKAVGEVVNDPSPGTAAKVGIGALITFIVGAGGYLATKRR